MKLTAAAFFLSSLSVLAVTARPPAMMIACRESATVEEFARCFLDNANSNCVDDTTFETVQLCLDGLETPPADIRDFVKSDCLDSVKECMRENAPTRGSGAFGGDRSMGGDMFSSRIMEACQESETMTDFVSCLVAETDLPCVDQATVPTIATCIEDLENPPANLRDLVQNSGCFDAASDCMKVEMEAFMATLPECFPESMSTLGECIYENKEACMTTCANASAPVLDIVTTDLGSCAGFQQAVMDPVCSTISCCEDCVEPFENLANCVVTEYLEFDEGCEFNCPVVRRNRELLFDRLKKWFGKGGPKGDGSRLDRPRFFGTCIDILRLASDTDTVTEEDVADFVGCLSEKYLEMLVREPMEGRRNGLRGDARPSMPDGDGN